MTDRFTSGRVKLGASEKSRALYLGNSYVMPVGVKTQHPEGRTQPGSPPSPAHPGDQSEGPAPGLGIRTGSLVVAAVSLGPTVLWLKTRK